MKKTLKTILICIGIVTVAWFVGTFFGKLAKADSCAEALRLTFTVESLSKVAIPIIMMAALAVAIMLQIVIHEAGHLVMGLLSGYKFLSFSAFGLILVNEGEGVRLKRFSLPGAGGQCLMIPPDREGGEVPVAAYNAGGVVFNLLLAIIAFLIIVLAHPTSLFVVSLLVGIIVIGVLIAAVNGIPMHVSGMPNDGYNMLKLGRNPKSREAFATLLRLNAMCTKGVRPKDIPAENFRLMKENECVDFTEPLQVNLLMVYTTHLIDAGQLDKVRKYLQQILDSQTKVRIFRIVAKYELASIGMLLGEKSDCESNMDKQDKAILKALEVSSSSVKRYRFLKALVADNDLTKAQSIYKDTVDHPDKFLVKGEWIMDTEIMGKVLEERKSDFPSEEVYQ